MIENSESALPKFGPALCAVAGSMESFRARIREETSPVQLQRCLRARARRGIGPSTVFTIHRHRDARINSNYLLFIIFTNMETGLASV